MRSVRHTDVYALTNLLFNGAFDYVDQRTTVKVPHFWSADGMVISSSDTNIVEDSFSIVTDETITDKEGASDYVKVLVVSGDTVSWKQSFVADPLCNVLDFPVPLEPNTSRNEVKQGFLSPYTKTLARSRDYTFGVSARVIRGKADLSVRFLDTQGSLITESLIQNQIDSRFANREWRRYSAVLSPSTIPAYIELTIRRSTGSELLEIHLSLFQLVLGAYSAAPYTGDQSVSAIPKDVIIMSMGTECPSGFIELEEPAGEVPAEWLKADQYAKKRKYSFPIGVDSNPGNETVGSPTHNRSDGYDFTLAVDQVIPFESFSSTWGSSTTGNVSYNPNVRCPADEPNDRGKADHEHNVLEGASIPAHRQFKFCRRL